MSGLIAWLTGLPLAVLYPIMTVAAAIENVFPPIPADSIVALGSWLAARGEGSVMGAFLATWIGNVGGAAAMYFVGRRHGAGWMHKRFPALGNARNEKRLETMYGKYGIATLIVSRLIPGVRALVPPFAGALKVPPLTAIGAMAIASAAWYGIISYVAFHADAEFSQLMTVVKESGTIVALVAAALLAVLGLVWFLRRRRHQRA
ncbi:MAG: DedA family protein [Gemmatimonadaceae bacterium]